MALAEGWTKLTVSPLLVLNDCQFNDRFWLACVTVVVAPFWLMVPLPAVTWPPVGPAMAECEAASNTLAMRRRLADLPLPLARSWTATQVWWT